MNGILYKGVVVLSNKFENFDIKVNYFSKILKKFGKLENF